MQYRAVVGRTWRHNKKGVMFLWRGTRTLGGRLRQPALGARTMFIGTETTPNPNSMKFLPQGKEVLPEEYGTGMYIQAKDKDDIRKSPLAKALFSTNGVKGLFFGKDFVTITKNTDEVWHILKPMIFSKMLDFYAEGLPVIASEGNEGITDTTIFDDDSEVVAMIKELLESKIRPNVQDDGGDIIYEGFDEGTGTVKVSLAGSCVGCPSSSVTLRNGVENMLMHYIPEVKGIEEVGGLMEDEDDDEPLVLRHTPQPIPQAHDGGDEESIQVR